jgi:hypothetical protein
MTFYILIFCWLTLLTLKFMLVKKKPCLDKSYGITKIIHLSFIETLIEFKLIFELFNSYGFINSLNGKITTSNDLNLNPSLVVAFIDRLGSGSGKKALILLLILLVLRFRLNLNKI